MVKSSCLSTEEKGTPKFCVDYRGLNAVTKADVFPLPWVDDLAIGPARKSRYFSTLDLSSGFWQIRIHPDSMERSTFTTPQGLSIQISGDAFWFEECP